MLEVTEAAKKQLHKTLGAMRTHEQHDKCFRIVPKDDKFLTLSLAKPAPSDSTFKHDGQTVLALPKGLQRVVENKSLDIDNSGKLKLS